MNSICNPIKENRFFEDPMDKIIIYLIKPGGCRT